MIDRIKKALNARKVVSVMSQREKGQSLVEMAITVPLIIFMLLGVFEVGNALRNYLVLVNVNREITRFSVRPGYLNFSTVTDIQSSYQRVRDWVDTTLSEQLALDFRDTGSIENTGNATLIVSHVVVDTGKPCEDMDRCDCDAFLSDPDYGFKMDDLIIHPGKGGMEFQAQRFGPAETVTGPRMTRIDYESLVEELAAQNNKFNCELIKKGGVPSANNLIVTELFLDQPQLFGFPFISNPYTDPVPLYTHTSMRLASGARSTGSENNPFDFVDTTGPVCMAYPITFGEDIFDDPDDPEAPQPIDAYEGDSPGNFGWLTWNPASANNNSGYVEDELQTPQMSMNDYTNVGDPDDHNLSIGDWVSTMPGVANSSGIDAQLQMLVGQEIIIPIYDNNPGSGEGAYYQITHFARIRVEQICLPRNGQDCDGESKKQIKATFLGYADELCTDGGGGGGPTPPYAGDDIATTTKNTLVEIDVLVNDGDADGDSVMVIGVEEINPFKGTLQVPPDGQSIKYQPKENDTGTYQFRYTISDGNGGTATATVTVTVE